MNFNRLKRSYSTLKGKNQVNTYSIFGLVVMLCGSLYVNFQKDTIVINNLNESCQSAQLSSGWMNEATHRRIGIMLANSLGNITPDNAKNIENTVLPFAAPEIYQHVDDLIALQLATVIEEEITMTFNPEQSFVEDGKTFVTGKGTMSGVTGKTAKYVRTYEFIFNVENYTPTFDYMTVYDDVPRDALWRSRNIKAEGK